MSKWNFYYIIINISMLKLSLTWHMKFFNDFHWFSMTFPDKLPFFQVNIKFHDFSSQGLNFMTFPGLCEPCLSDCTVTWVPRSNLSTTRYDLTPTGQRGKLYEKIFFTFDFHILPEHRRIGDKFFPCRCISIKNGDHLWGRCWPIYLESKPSLNCWIAVERAEITFISIHINANQNSYHDDKSIL